NQPIGVPLDVEHDPIIRQKVCRPKDSAHLSRTCPSRLFDHGEPEAKGLLGVRVFLPEFNERVPAEDAQLRHRSTLPLWEQARRPLTSLGEGARISSRDRPPNDLAFCCVVPS